jgi:hypothetical protein
MEIDTAGCRAYDRNFIVGGDTHGLKTLALMARHAILRKNEYVKENEEMMKNCLPSSSS